MSVIALEKFCVYAMTWGMNKQMNWFVIIFGLVSLRGSLGRFTARRQKGTFAVPRGNVLKLLISIFTL